MNYKHAFLIIAHKCDYTLETLLSMLDHPDNDIFLHMDKKTEFNPEKYTGIVKYSSLFFTPRIDVAWGGDTLIKVELLLMREAYNSNCRYHYFHLLSGEDLPIKSMSYIHDFFKDKDCDFIHIEKAFPSDLSRVYYKHFFQNIIGRNKGLKFKILRFFQKMLVYLQKALHLERNKDITFYKGTQWFSLTSECVAFVLEHENWIKKHFIDAYCGDELFIQTLLMENKWDKVVNIERQVKERKILGRCYRKQDWDRGNPGNPYVWRLEDIDELLSDEINIFARKFNCIEDKEIITYIKNNI